MIKIRERNLEANQRRKAVDAGFKHMCLVFYSLKRNLDQKYKMAFLKREERKINPLELRIKIENSVTKVENGSRDKQKEMLCKFCPSRRFMLE